LATSKRTSKVNYEEGKEIMYYVLGESAETGDFEIWESLTAKEAMAVRNEYIKLGLQTKAGKMIEIG
jgi:predicted kinase